MAILNQSKIEDLDRQYAEKIKGLSNGFVKRVDNETVHMQADDFLIQALTEFGMWETVRAFSDAREATPFWYS